MVTTNSNKKSNFSNEGRLNINNGVKSSNRTIKVSQRILHTLLIRIRWIILQYKKSLN